MSKCAGLISTAGFESVAEAMYLDKPVMMVPVPNHIEQMINAFDGERAGAGLAAETFDLDVFAEYLPHHVSVESTYHWWCAKAKNLFLGHLEELVANRKMDQVINLKNTTPKNQKSGAFAPDFR
jgi:UDP-N-acetylglucosamine:LPS N-acetylglucosamine transferase